MAAVAAVASLSCQPQPAVTETGVVIAVDGPTAADVDRISLRTDDGRVLQLTVGVLELSGGGLAAPHLREHLVSGEPITVYLKGNEITRYTDAPSQ